MNEIFHPRSYFYRSWFKNRTRWFCAPFLVGCVLSVVFLFLSCSQDKLALTQNYGYLDSVYAHWFENEKTAYLFFELHETDQAFLDPVFELAFSEQVLPAGRKEHDFKVIDFSQGVHEHTWQVCAPKTYCGSISWPQTTKIDRVKLRFRYDRSSPLALDTEIIPSAHFVSELGNDSFSAIPFGVFDSKNQHIQVRIHHNFGVPSHDWILKSGMKKKFAYRNPQLIQKESLLTEVRSFMDSHNGFPFPAKFCPSLSSGTQLIANRHEWWLPDEFSSSDNDDLGACLDVDFMDKNQNVFFSQPAYAMRNPIVGTDAQFSFPTPLRDLTQIPILIEACSDVPGSESLRSEDFLSYQKYILGVTERSVDVCFRIHNTPDFKDRLKNHLVTRLSTAKSQGGNQDFIFVVIFNERLSLEFFDVHAAIAEAITNLASGERENVSPRLVGGFVYGSTSSFAPTQAQTKYVLWCPQTEQEDRQDPLNRDLTKSNCTTLKTPELKILGINFILPMGPLPDLETYEDYVKRHGDKGLAKNPQLRLVSVPSNTNTRIEKEQQVSYLDAQRITIAPHEYIKVCSQKPEASRILPALRFQSSAHTELDGLSIFEIESLWTSDEDAAEYRIGIQWEYPFMGGISYKSDLQIGIGPIVSPIPFVRSQQNYKEIGDQKWQTQVWPLGQFLWKCQKYCDHPYFDEAGTYQLTKAWRAENFSGNCPELKIPSWNGGDRL
ncbi:MAG: hypothetical protein KA436_07015 [Oligoflexales bacterium]|nr:hypothetical protein [Oligoflexales bacterium]